MTRKKYIAYLILATVIVLLVMTIHLKNNEISMMSGSIDGLNEVISVKDDENSRLKQEIEDLKSPGVEFMYLGSYKITYYCDERRDHICGGSGVTASGAPTDVGTTIAVDPSVIPYGTEVYIDGIGYRTAQDRGGAVNGNHIDVLVKTHDEALSKSVTYNDVWAVIKKD